MSEHKAHINWNRTTDSFAYDDYNREHTWTYENGVVVEASAAPQFLGKEDRVDPEEAFVAALSACHMLTFIAFCAKKRIVVDSYQDDAVGYLEKNEAGKLCMTRITLRPRVAFAEGHEPPQEVIDKLHHRAHENCFLANSVKTEITVEQD